MVGVGRGEEVDLTLKTMKYNIWSYRINGFKM